MNVTAHQEKEENKETKKGRRKKGENRRPILKMLCVALLRLFRGQHSKKMNRSARGNWDPREGQQSFRPNPNGVGDRTTTLRRLLISADRNDFVYVNNKEEVLVLFVILSKLFKRS